MVLRRQALILELLCVLWLFGCATSAPPPPKRTVQTPGSGLNELDLIVRAIPPVGKVLPVQIAVTNLMTKPITIQLEQIRAGRADGSTVGVLSPDQAKEEAGGADKLIAALSQVYLVHREGRQKEPTRAQLVAAGCLLPFAGRPSATGAELGAAWIVFVCPIIIVGGVSKSLAVAASSGLQVDDISLNGYLESGIENQGYIFLPLGEYKTIELPTIDRNTDGLETIVQPWDSAAQVATETPVNGELRPQPRQ